MCSKTKVRKLDFAFARPLTGKSTPLISKANCSSAECFSKSLIGRKIRRSFRSSDEHFGLAPRLVKGAGHFLVGHCADALGFHRDVSLEIKLREQFAKKMSVHQTSFGRAQDRYRARPPPAPCPASTARPSWSR